MTDNTGIEWCDATWNPLTGCDKVSPGCDHCYAETIAHRFDGTKAYPNGFAVTLRPERLDQPMRWRKPRRIFVNSMSDLFHDSVPDDYIAKVFAVMLIARHHTFQVLTKRHGRMRALLCDIDFRDRARELAYEDFDLSYEAQGQLTHAWPLPNVWMGVSAENQQWADIRIPALLDTPAAIRFISAEPLLGPISIFANSRIDRDPGLDWVIVGGESGHGARPMYPGWLRSLRDECRRAGTAFLFKQWGEWVPESMLLHKDNAPAAFLAVDGTVRHLVNGKPTTTPMSRGQDITIRKVGKKAAGRELDSRTWDEYPEAVKV